MILLIAWKRTYDLGKASARSLPSCDQRVREDKLGCLLGQISERNGLSGFAEASREAFVKVG